MLSTGAPLQRAHTNRSSTLSTAAPSEAAASRGYQQGTGGELLERRKKKLYFLTNNKQEEFLQRCLAREGQRFMWKSANLSVANTILQCFNPQYIYKYFKSLQAASHTLVYPQLLFLTELSDEVHHPTAGDTGACSPFRSSCKRKSDQQAG